MIEHETDKDEQAATAPQRRRTRKHGLRVGIGVAVVFLVIGVVLGLSIARSQSAGDRASLAEAKVEVGKLQTALSQTEERNWTYYRDTQTSSSGTTATTIAVPGTYTDGVYLVGKEIQPGTYDGVVTGKVGYWARLKNTTGFIDGIIANGLPGGPFVLTIYPSDMAVELRGVTLTAQ